MTHRTPDALPRRFHIQTRAPDIALAGFRGLYGDVQVELPDSFEWRVRLIELGPVLVAQGACDVAVSLDVAPSTFMLSLSTSGPIRATSRGSTSDVAPGLGAGVFSPASRTTWTTGDAIKVITVRIDPQFLTSQLEAITGEVVGTSLVFAPAIRTDAGSGAYVERLCQFLAAEVDKGPALDHPAVAAGLVESLARALLVGQPHNHDHLLHRPAPPSSQGVVQRLEEYIDAHAGGPITMADLAADTGVSVRSIEAAFQQRRGITPAAFLRARRLHRARRMLFDELRIPVLQVAYAAGFTRPATFAAAYFKAFGERPEDTRRRGLLSAGPPPSPAEDRAPHADRLALLSPREREVCEGVARGTLNKQIAAEIGISERTVKEYRANAMAKLGVTSAAEVAMIFSKAGG
jgi:AraC-like DNA-binding protein/DNA-binding CsgD family transcriptional regulator